MTSGTLIFDGDCGFCTKSAKWIQARSKSLEIMKWQDLPSLEGLGLTRIDVQSRAYFVRNSRVLGSGPMAIGQSLILCRQPWKTLGVVIQFPIIRQFAEKVYVVIARNRHKMPGSSDSCKL